MHAHIETRDGNITICLYDDNEKLILKEIDINNEEHYVRLLGFCWQNKVGIFHLVTEDDECRVERFGIRKTVGIPAWITKRAAEKE